MKPVSPIRVGTRLEQLQALERRTQQEIGQARFRLEVDKLPKLRALLQRIEGEIVAEGGKPAGRPRKPHYTSHKKAADHVYARLEQLGVTAHEVKVWAVEVGLLDVVRRGRIRGELVEAYATREQEGAA